MGNMATENAAGNRIEQLLDAGCPTTGSFF